MSFEYSREKNGKGRQGREEHDPDIYRERMRCRRYTHLASKLCAKREYSKYFGTHSYSNKVTGSVKFIKYKLTCDVAICYTVWWNSQIRLRSFKKMHSLWLGFIQGMKDF